MSYVLSQSGLDKARVIRKEYTLRRQAMSRKHLEWLETLYAVHGEQHRVLRGGQIVDMGNLRTDDTEHITVTHNYLFQSYKAMVASVLQNDPAPVVALARAGRDGRSLARSCERILTWLYHDKNMRRAVRSSVSWAFTTGIGFLGAVWDLSAEEPQWVPDLDDNDQIIYKTKKEVMTDADGNTVTSAFGTPLTEDVLVPQGDYRLLGDLTYFAPSPFDVFPERVRDWSCVRNLVMRQYMHKDALVDMFGSKAKTLSTDVSPKDFVRFDEYGDQQSGGEHSENMVLTLSYYEKPSLESPKGKYNVVANNQLLHEDDLPGGMLPIHPVYDTEHPSHLFGESAIRQALNIQRDLNSAEADLKMDRRMHAHPRLIAEQGSLVKGATRVPNVPGAIIEVRPSAKMPPHFLQSPSLPSWVERAPDRLQRAMEDITGAHGLSKGEQKGIMSGRQASVVLAADRQKWSPTIRSMAEAVQHVSELSLMLWKNHGPPSKTIEVYGPVGTPTDVMVFYRDYIPDHIRVRIEVSALQPFNEEIRRQQIMEAWQVGAIPDQRMLWKLLRHGEMGRMLGNDEPSRARARQENDLLDNATNINVEQHEDHAAHMDEHLERMRDPGWYSIPPQAQQAYRMHVAQHDAFIQNARNPVMTGQSQMPSLPREGAQLQNLAPSMTGAANQSTMPGLSVGQEAGMPIPQGGR